MGVGGADGGFVDVADVDDGFEGDEVEVGD